MSTQLGLAAAGGLVALLVVIRRGTGETRLMRGIRVHAPPATLMQLVSCVDRMPEWYVRAGALPRPLRHAHFAAWGDPVPSRDRLSVGHGGDPVQTRSIPDREFGYRRTSPRTLRYESLFRVVPGPVPGETLLQWDLRYRLLRPVDALVPPWSSTSAVSRVMETSLEAIRSAAEKAAVRPSWERGRPLAS